MARDLGYDGLSFLTGDIQSYVSGEPIDMVVTLHACDVATDAAIVQAIGWDCRIPVSYTHLDVYKRQVPTQQFIDLL